MRLIHAASFATIEDLSLDGPTADEGQFYLVTAGIRGYGPTERITVRRVEISYLRGTVNPSPIDGKQHEAFGISFDAGTGGHVVEDCLVSGEPDTYLSAFSGVDGATKPVIFERCHADCGSGYAAFTIYDHTIVRDCTSSLFGYSIYNDTGNIANAVVEGGVFRSGRVAIGLVGDHDTTKANIRIQGAYFSTSAQGAVGLELAARAATAKFRNIDVIGCRFVQSHPSKLTIFSSNANPDNCASLNFRECTFPAGCVTNARGVKVSFTNCRWDNGLPVLAIPSV